MVDVNKTALDAIDHLLKAAKAESLLAQDGNAAMKLTQAALNAANALVVLTTNGLAIPYDDEPAADGAGHGVLT